VVKIKKKKTININKLFKKTKFNYIDWYKTDIQGFDLKLFKSLNKKLQKSITIVDLEVAFYSFYKNEDNIWDVMKTMSKNFFLDEIKTINTIKGSFKTVNKLGFFEKKGLQMFGRKSPTYTNLSFIKNKKNVNLKNKRSILFYIIILILKKRFIEVIDLLNIIKVDKDPIFDDIKSYCFKSVNIFSLKYFLRLPITLLLKIKNLVN